MHRRRHVTTTDMLRSTWILSPWIVVWISAACGSYCSLSTSDQSQLGWTPDKKCSQFDLLNDVSGSVPGPVTSFEVSTNYNPRRYLNISWNTPANGADRYVAGYAVRVRGTDDSCCFLFNLTHSPPYADKSKYELMLTIMEEKHYSIEVSSLPRTLFNIMTASLSIKHNRKYDSEDCALNSCWVSDLVLYDGSCEDRLTVTFNMAPANESFDNYTVSLMKKSSLNTDAVLVVQQNNSQKLGIAMFKKANETLKDRVVKLIPRGKKCIGNQCTITTSEPFDFHAADDQASCVIKSPVVNDGELAAIIVGSVLLAAAIITIVILLAKRQLSDGPGFISDTVTTSSEQILVPGSNEGRNRRELVSAAARNPTRKSVFLLYSGDNKHHQNVVGNFKEFLSRLCHCDVIYDVEHQRSILERKEEWIRSVMESSDYILMLNSEGTYWRAMATNQGLYYPPNDVCFIDTFPLAFRILNGPDGSRYLRKLILAHFSYTPMEYRSPPLAGAQDKSHFQLMMNMEELYTYIHGTDCPSSVSEFTCDEPTDEGERLRRAISLAQSYVKENPAWFVRIHGTPLPAVTSSDQKTNPSSPSSFRRLERPHHGHLPLSEGPSSIFRKPTTNAFPNYPTCTITPSDQISLTSSALGEAIAEINDSGYEASGGFAEHV